MQLPSMRAHRSFAHPAADTASARARNFTTRILRSYARDLATENPGRSDEDPPRRRRRRRARHRAAAEPVRRADEAARGVDGGAGVHRAEARLERLLQVGIELVAEDVAEALLQEAV